jgi:hypothetical protein
MSPIDSCLGWSAGARITCRKLWCAFMSSELSRAHEHPSMPLQDLLSLVMRSSTRIYRPRTAAADLPPTTSKLAAAAPLAGILRSQALPVATIRQAHRETGASGGDGSNGSVASSMSSHRRTRARRVEKTRVVLLCST